MPITKYIDTAGLPKSFDIADLAAMNLTPDEVTKWFKDRIRPGMIPAPKANGAAKPKAAPKRTREAPAKPKAKAIDKPPVATSPGPPSNVVPLQQNEEDLGIPPEYSEDSLAESFSEKHKNSLIYVHSWKKWMIWENSSWKIDETNTVVDLSRKICKKASSEALQRQDLGAKSLKIANQISKLNTFKSVEQIARTDRRHTAVPAQFDADQWILNTPDGVVDLRTGELRPAHRDDFASKSAAIGPGGECPTWLKFLDDTTGGDQEMQSYLARMAGYCLTGSVAEHVFFFVYGTGGNGKGVFINQLDWMLKSYSRVAQMETFTEQRFTKHATEIAYFQGARLVTAQETEEGKRWNESRVKTMTGGDSITANHMHKDPFTFQPTFKLLFAGNHKPALRNIDEAIKRRMHLIPFDITVPAKDRDPMLSRKLQAEAGGILSWAIAGCLDWQKQMLNPPERVLATTQEYFQSEDTMGNFFDECCHIGQFLQVRTTSLYSQYQGWAKRTGEYALPRKRFLDILRIRDLHSEKKSGEQVVIGIELKQSEAQLSRQGGWDYND